MSERKFTYLLFFCTGCMFLSTSRCSSQERQPGVSKTSPYSSNIFIFESRPPYVFLFVIFMSCISSFTWSLFTLFVTRFSARLADADIRKDPLLYLPLETVMWSLLDLDSLHILYQLRHNVFMTEPSYIRSFDFVKSGIPILKQFTDEWMWNYISWCTTVTMTFHDTFTAFCFIRKGALYRFFFNVLRFLFNNVCWLIAGWLFRIL